MKEKMKVPEKELEEMHYWRDRMKNAKTSEEFQIAMNQLYNLVMTHAEETGVIQKMIEKKIERRVKAQRQIVSFMLAYGVALLVAIVAGVTLAFFPDYWYFVDNMLFVLNLGGIAVGAINAYQGFAWNISAGKWFGIPVALVNLFYVIDFLMNH